MYNSTYFISKFLDALHAFNCVDGVANLRRNLV